MEIEATAKYIRMSPRKARLVVDMVRGMAARDAVALLRFQTQAAAEPVSKLISSAIANAEENYGLAADELYVAEISSDTGPTLRRGRFAARGRYKPILKRSTHLKVVLATRED